MNYSITSDLFSFRRYERMIAQLCTAYTLGEPISWDVGSSGYNADYVRNSLRIAIKSFIENPAWESPHCTREVCIDILANWKFRNPDRSTLEVGPRRRGFRVLGVESTASTESPPETTQPKLSVDGTSFPLVSAISLLKNHDQIPFPVLLIDLNPAFLDELYATYPNVEYIQDTIAGVHTPNYILI